MNKIPMFRLIKGWGIGRGIHKLKARVRDRVGAMINRDVEVVKGRRGSLINSFMASANGCRMP